VLAPLALVQQPQLCLAQPNFLMKLQRQRWHPPLPTSLELVLAGQVEHQRQLVLVLLVPHLKLVLVACNILP